MAAFPRTEADLVQLAQEVVAGFKANPEFFPSPVVDPDDLRAALEEFYRRSGAANEAAAIVSERYAAKAAAMSNLIELTKANVRYAEFALRDDPDRLQLIGWSGRKRRTPTKAPGQARNLDTVKEGVGWIKLDWKKPAEGGRVSSYRVESRLLKQGEWRQAGMSARENIELTDQEHGVELEYRVFAVNKAGEGPPSNLVTAVL